MLRSCLAAFALSTAMLAGAQTTPSTTTPQQQQQQPGFPQPAPPAGAADPTAPTTAAPPAYVPGTDTEPAAARGPIRISGGVMAGLLQTKVDPIYPPDAKAAGQEGTVVLAALINKKGMVQELRVVSGSSSMAEAATAAVKQWTYRPYMLNGQPVDVRTVITVHFSLQPPGRPPAP